MVEQTLEPEGDIQKRPRELIASALQGGDYLISASDQQQEKRRST